nr:GMC oxidoreductase [Saccharothrix sp. ST-888]
MRVVVYFVLAMCLFRSAGYEEVVRLLSEGRPVRFRAAREVVLSLGAVQTPKILMQSGIGPARHLEQVGLAVREDLPGVGANLDDHLLVGCVWEADPAAELPPPPRAQAVCFWGSDDGRADSPKFVMYSGAGAFMSPEAQARYGGPEAAFTFLLGMRLRSRGSVRLADADPASAPVIETGYFDEPGDLRDAVEAYRFAEEIAHADAMSPYRGSRAIPGTGSDAELAAYIRTAANTFWHQCGTARVGTDADAGAVVDSELRVRGVEALRIADASVLPRVTSGNTMAPCVVVGHRAAELIRGWTRSSSLRRSRGRARLTVLPPSPACWLEAPHHRLIGWDAVPTVNRLVHAQSPHLQRHATNRVDWWEWGEEAMSEAARRDVPILLSVGCASCHYRFWRSVIGANDLTQPGSPDLGCFRGVPAWTRTMSGWGRT